MSVAEITSAVGARLPAAGSRAFAVLDFDNTCIVNDIAEATLAFLCRHKLLKNMTLLPQGKNSGEYHAEVFRRYHSLLEKGGVMESYIFCAHAFAGFTPEEAGLLVIAALEEEGSVIGETELYGVAVAKGLSPRPEIREIIGFLEKRKIGIWIISSSPEIAVRTAMRQFKIFGNLIGLKNQLENRVFLPKLERPVSILEGKVECIKKMIDAARPPLLAIGDGINDLPMLEYAEIKAVVDRGNAMGKKARKRGWFLLLEAQPHS